MADEAKSGAGGGAAAAAAASTEPEGPLRDIEAKVNELYHVHDRVFLADKAAKQAKMSAMVDAIVAAVEAVEAPSSSEEKAALLYYHGKALDALEAYSAKAEDCLSAAIKLDPSRVDAWNCLGNCFWKKKDLKAAKNCFEGVPTKNPASLRQLSMLTRQVYDTPAERQENIKASVGIAKQAVALDVADPESWYVLGNAYLTKFFAVDHKHEDLVSAMKAYSRADTGSGSGNPDLHYNRANVLMFQEEYDAAVAAYKKAHSIDPALSAADHVDGIIRHVKRVGDLVVKKAKLKPKKLAALVKSLPTAEVRAKVEESKDAGGRSFCMLADLKAGANPGKMILVKLLMSAIRTDNPPATMVMIDSDQTTMALSLYHLTSSACDRFSSRDTFIVVDPIVKPVSLNQGGVRVAYPCIQVVHPEAFYVNGRSISGSFAHADLQISNFDH